MINIEEIKKSINDKSSDLLLSVKNFDNDINNMTNISEQIGIWVNNGVDLSACTQPLSTQIQDWKNKMQSLFDDFKNNITNLKEVDDRITNENNDIIDELSNINDSDLENWEKLIEIYSNLFNTLEEDIYILNDATSNLEQYDSLGVKLGDAISTINQQIQDISNSITLSTDSLDDIISQIQDECGKVEIENENNSLETIEEEGPNIKSQHIEQYSGTKKSVEFDHSVIQNNQSAFEFHAKFNTPGIAGHAIVFGSGEGGNRFYVGWQVNSDGRLMVGLGSTNVYSLTNYTHLVGTDIDFKYIQYGDKTARFVINGVEEDLIDVPEYTYSSTETFYYNGHYGGFATHTGTTYEYTLYA